MSFLTGAIRVAAASSGSRAALMKRAAVPAAMQVRLYSDHSESFEEFNERYVKFFEGVQDQFEAQRGLNNAFAYDLVPSPEVLEAALKAARRVNDFALAVRIFEGIKHKTENDSQYKQYLEVLKPLREELGVPLKEELYHA
ncbi:Similar to S.cerevisiae protein COX6 (Subunit VI of cytochrome c oxidase (Complex IV)) [Malassezia sympodialis ATCC 42132]|uniref:Cytochrome c oxidase subunit 6, mitochondrial n=1 Tax=Malassezia sympodialis (strain ATCC 42132) TaxID=1230383 RepID=A0A1M8A1A1_MALS4|nr:Similar to S.cerevisiae protein COX6 (Subunit VI of cytochrome c oxidase (Complex IV)) [Malassezia sympodialis ATCC 42132]